MSEHKTFIDYTGDSHVNSIIEQWRSDKTMHSLCNVTWGETFDKLWEMINLSQQDFFGYLDRCIKATTPDEKKLKEYSDLKVRIEKEGMKELKKNVQQRLIDEIRDGHGMCFTGRLTRLVNVLSGIHPGFVIPISGADQINAKIKATENVVLRDNDLKDESNDTRHDFWIKTMKPALEANLREIDVSDEDIAIWLDPLAMKYDPHYKFDDEYDLEETKEEGAAMGGGAREPSTKRMKKLDGSETKRMDV